MLLHTQDGAPVSAANPEPVALYGPNGSALFANPRAAADGLALPTAPDVLATLLGYNRAAANLKLLSLLLGTADMAATDQLLETAAQLYVYDATAGVGKRANAANTQGDGQDGSRTIVTTHARWNGSSYDRDYGNNVGTLLAPAARTATTATGDQTNFNSHGVVLWLNITAAAGGGETVTLQIQGKDPTSGQYTSWRATAGQTATGTYVLMTYPGSGQTAHDGFTQVGDAVLPRTWRASVAHSGAGSWTYSIGYALIV